MLDELKQNAIKGTMESILLNGGKALFYSFTNGDGKQWIMPKRNLSTAMNLYQPSHLKGKMVKQWLPYLHWIGFVRKILGVQSQFYELTDELNQQLCTLFEVQHIEFSIFCGTPSVHQKITIQISSGRKILGYCKVTGKEKIKNIFKQEQQVLKDLNEKGIKQIPTCLYADNLNKNIAIFVQTTVKTNASKIKHEWSKGHLDFLNKLYNITKVKYPFEETDFAKSLCVLEGYLSVMPNKEAEIIKKAISSVRNYFGSGLVEFSAYHADFTPWNMFFEKGELFVFDFEYAKTTYPPFLDFFHFITQVSIIERNYSFERIFEYCENTADQVVVFKNNFSELYLCYLLTVVSFHFEINKQVLDKDDRCYSRWLSLIDLIVNKK